MSDQLFQLWVSKVEGGRTWIWRHSIDKKVEDLLQKLEVSSILWRTVCFVASEHIYSFEVKCYKRNLFVVQGGKRRSHCLLKELSATPKAMAWNAEIKKAFAFLHLATWHGCGRTHDGRKSILVKKGSSCNKNVDEPRTSPIADARKSSRCDFVWKT